MISVSQSQYIIGNHCQGPRQIFPRKRNISRHLKGCDVKTLVSIFA